MLREIINFTSDLAPELLIRDVQPSEGLQIMIWLTKSGKLENYDYKPFKKNQEVTPFLKECLMREINSKCVSMNKALDSKKKIHSCSPFCVAFKFKTFKSGEANQRYDNYFEVAKSYCQTKEQEKWTDLLYKFCKMDIDKFIEKIRKEIEESREDKRQFKFSDNHYIWVYLGNISISEFEQVHQNYLCCKVFNKEEFNVKQNGKTFGVSDYLTGYNQKKPFLQHLTASFDVNNRVSSEDALWLYRFSQLKANNQLPNPLPIFIEKRELNQEVVEIFNRDKDIKISYSQIIEAIYQKYQDLGNYYLLNIQGKAVKDFDFVSSFSFHLDPPVRIQPLFIESGSLVNSGPIRNIFEFEREIVWRIFNNQLVQKIKDGGWRYRYFDDIGFKPQYMSATTFQLILKYRKAFYDFIYKSKRETVNNRMFHDIMQTSILDDLGKDEQHNKSFTIKEKLNIWFSLYEFFDQSLKKGENDTMANQVVYLQERMKEVTQQRETHITNDNEFAFAAGQVIYFLLDQSETANKTHALLEPFLQKNDCEQLKTAISRTLDRYKHKIGFYARRFNKLAAEVLGYSTGVNMKNLMPLILAGYFSDNIIYGKKEVETTTLS